MVTNKEGNLTVKERYFPTYLLRVKQSGLQLWNYQNNDCQRAICWYDWHANGLENQDLVSIILDPIRLSSLSRPLKGNTLRDDVTKSAMISADTIASALDNLCNGLNLKEEPKLHYIVEIEDVTAVVFACSSQAMYFEDQTTTANYYGLNLSEECSNGVERIFVIDENYDPIVRFEFGC